jgi:hypothetical protein
MTVQRSQQHFFVQRIMKHLPRTACVLAFSLSVLLSLHAEPDKTWQNLLVKREADQPVLRYVNAKLPAEESKPAVEAAKPCASRCPGSGL